MHHQGGEMVWGFGETRGAQGPEMRFVIPATKIRRIGRPHATECACKSVKRPQTSSKIINKPSALGPLL